MYGKIEETSDEETLTGDEGVNDEQSEGNDEAGSDSGPNPDSNPESQPNPDSNSDSRPDSDSELKREALTALRFVGPATARALDGTDVTAADFRERRVSYRELVDVGVNAGVAARIRREYSLSWTFDSSAGDLGRRSAQVRGLDDEERAWIAASSGDWEDADRTAGSADEDDGEGDDAAVDTSEGDWEATGNWGENRTGALRSTEADGSGDPMAAESAWRERSAPEPVVTLDGIDEDIAADLAEAGVTSVRRLSTIDPEHVADALQIDVERVREWHEAARAHRA